MSSEHFCVDGTLIEAWASMKSFRPKDESGKPVLRFKPTPALVADLEHFQHDTFIAHSVAP